METPKRAGSASAERVTPKGRNDIRPDAQAFDEIRIITVPRYKESGLSGDEWRISTKALFMRNGVVVHEEENAGRNIETAAGMLYHHLMMACDHAAHYAGDGIHCDQEGCSEPATTRLRKLFDYCRHGHKTEITVGPAYRHFCDKHNVRGDCGLDDADRNYEAA